MSAFSNRLNTMLSGPRRLRTIHERHDPAIQDWQEEHRCVYGDFTGTQFARFRLWQAYRRQDGDPADVVPIWFDRTHREFLVALFTRGLIGTLDTDDAVRAELRRLDAIAAEGRAGV